jgi:hypothetical protein
MAQQTDLKSAPLRVQVPPRLPLTMKTVSSDKIRNPYAPLAKKRKSGKIRSKKDKRRNGKNKQQEFLKEANE